MTTLNATKVLKSLTILLVSAIALFSLYVYIALNWSYSSGERAGFLQKVSHKGWICKTWEGELSLGGNAWRRPREISLHSSR